mmetsp:Transcript_14474/g.18920  ORF Transcript_14474/g.18920 Transcript_14474/m.18920 type:complete len:88 (+) Transcript_14474:254-517(+)
MLGSPIGWPVGPVARRAGAAHMEARVVRLRLRLRLQLQRRASALRRIALLDIPTGRLDGPPSRSNGAASTRAKHVSERVMQLRDGCA